MGEARRLRERGLESGRLLLGPVGRQGFAGEAAPRDGVEVHAKRRRRRPLPHRLDCGQFAVDEDGRVALVDGENFVLVDQKALNETGAPGWNVAHTSDGFGCRTSFCYSSEDLCTHHESDHNLYGVCKSLLSSTTQAKDMPEGLLHSPPPPVLRR